MAKTTESKIEEDKEGFDRAFKQFFAEKDPQAYEEAIGILLDNVDLADVFYDLLDEEGGVESFFFMWSKAWKKEDKNSPDIEGLRDLGKLSKKYYNKKNYKKLHALFFDVTFNSLLRYIDIKNHEDFEELTDVDLFERHLIPSEIFLQFFLLESPLKMKDFDWDRSEEVMQQHLALLIVLFDDIYVFFHEDKDLRVGARG